MVKLSRFCLFYCITKHFLFRNVRLDVKGLENVPENRGFIVASNHEHSWDPPIITVALGKHIHFLAIDSIFTRTLSEKKWLSRLERLVFGDSISGLFLRLMQQIPVSYENKNLNKKAFLRAAHYLRKKKTVGIFPEGEINLEKKKNFLGVAILAQRNDAEILPVRVQTNAPADSFLKLNFTKARVNVGKPLQFSKSANYTKKKVMERIYKLKDD